MKNLHVRNSYCLWISALLAFTGPINSRSADCAVSDASKLPSEDGCKLAFMYNQSGDHRLVVIDEKNHRRLEAATDGPRMAPFWEGGKVHVLAHSGMMQGFTVGSDKLIPDKEEAVCAGVVREMEYVRSQHRLYLIRTSFDAQHRPVYELSATDFPARKTIWTKKIDDPGLLRIVDPYVCMTGLKQVQVFNCETGEKLGGINGAKAAASSDADAQK